MTASPRNQRVKLADVSLNYDSAARWYDVLTVAILDYVLGLRSLRARALDRMEPLSGARVLDLGCGTGLNFSGLLTRLGPDGRLVGVDYSQGMLGKAREKVRGNGWEDRVTLVRDDAVELDLVEPPFDAVLAYWCLGIVYDLNAALDSALGVLKPGGRFVIVDFGRSRSENRLLACLYPLYRKLLIWARIDAPADLDSRALRQRWAVGKAVLKRRLEDYEEDAYLGGLGLFVSGRAPY